MFLKKVGYFSIEYLNIYVTGQEHAKEILAVAFSRFIVDGILTSQLIIGPSGSGKTYMASILGNLCGLKFVNIGIANLSSQGIKGDNFKDQLKSLKGHTGKAILFLDEIDKLADSNNPNGQTIQSELLSLFNTESPGQEYEGIDLKSILILGAGAFEDNGKGKSLYNMLKKKSGNKIDVFEALDDSDLIEYGLKPEIVGRFVGKTHLLGLSVEYLYNILTKKGSEIIKLTEEFKKYRINLIFEDEALLKIAKTAFSGVGARALKSILEKIIKEHSIDKIKLAGKTIVISKADVDKINELGSSAEKEIDWNDTKSIIKYLNKFIPGNKSIKRTLANSFKDLITKGKLSHTLVIGESGSGKTCIINLLCKAAGIQLGEASLANVVSEGFKGTSISDIIRNAFSKGYMGKSPLKVLFLDEIDKLVSRTGRLGGGDFGTDITNELLNLFNSGNNYGIDFSNCLIISAGACAGNIRGESLTTIIQKRLGGANKINISSIVEQVSKEDLEIYGFKNELVGRFKRISYLEPVNKEYLKEVMFNSEISAYRKILAESVAEGYAINFTYSAIEVILNYAVSMKTGVRALEITVNKLFDNIYEDFGPGEVNIDENYAKNVLNPKINFEHPDFNKINWTSPQTVKDYLDTKVSGNEIYKKSLSLMFWKLKKKQEKGNENIKVPNLLVLGPSGGGKTYMLKLLSPLLGIPFGETNIARVENNYPREKIGDVFDQIGDNVTTAVIFIDEIDKTLMNPKHPFNNELMSYIEGGTYNGRSLKDFVFVGAGAFQGYNVCDIDGNVSLRNLQNLGVKTEVLGRFGNICGVEKMNLQKMKSILISEESVFNKRIITIKDEYGIDVTISESALDYICEIATKQPTGARVLDLITNMIFTGFEFNINKYLKSGEIYISKDILLDILSNLDY